MKVWCFLNLRNWIKDIESFKMINLVQPTLSKHLSCIKIYKSSLLFGYHQRTFSPHLNIEGDWRIIRSSKSWDSRRS